MSCSAFVNLGSDLLDGRGEIKVLPSFRNDWYQWRPLTVSREKTYRCRRTHPDTCSVPVRLGLQEYTLGRATACSPSGRFCRESTRASRGCRRSSKADAPQPRKGDTEFGVSSLRSTFARRKCNAGDVTSCDRSVRVWVALLVLTCVALVGAACSESRSALSSGTPARSGAPSSPTHVRAVPSSATTTTATTTPTSAPLSAGSFFVEPCANIVGSPLVTSSVDLQPFLLSAAQLPAGAIIDGPHQTSSTPPIYASVPTTSPAAYENISLSGASTRAGTADVSLSEVIGDVGSASFASQLLSMLDVDLNGPGCNPSGEDMVLLPGTSPPVSATLSAGTQRGRSELGARLFAAKGSRLVCLTWGSGVSVRGSGDVPGRLPPLPPLPDKSEMARVLNSALALIPT